ncbi:MAG: hypothetical protein MI799_21895 [Desulfobacterales bacterium]|nr:hypothetical protein [Desulfobacterales bacterium]
MKKTFFLLVCVVLLVTPRLSFAGGGVTVPGFYPAVYSSSVSCSYYLYMTNISGSKIDVTIKFYNNAGAEVDLDNSNSVLVVNAYGPSGTTGNHELKTTDGTFTMNPEEIYHVTVRRINDSTTQIFSGNITWKAFDDSNNEVTLVDKALVVNAFVGYRSDTNGLNVRYNFPVNGNLPF